MADVRYNPAHHAGGTPQERIAARLRNSGCDADEVAQHGEGPTRTITNIHHSGSAGLHGLVQGPKKG